VSISANSAAFKVYFKRTAPHQIITSNEFTCSTEVLFHKESVLIVTNAAAVPGLLQLAVQLRLEAKFLNGRKGELCDTKISRQ